MTNKDLRQFLRNNKLLLPRQPNHDDFLTVMEMIFKWSCLIGVLGSKRYFCYFWSAFILLVLLFMESQAIWKVIKALAGWAIDMAGQRSFTARIAGTMFYTIAIVSLILASKLYRSWGDIAVLWARIERIMAVKVPADRTLKKRMYFISGFMTVCAMLEHILSMISLIGLDCPPSLIIKRYVLLSHGFMILRHEYSDWYALPLIFMSTVATLLWNFQDQMIVLISVGLASRYHRLNQCLVKICAFEKKQMDSYKPVFVQMFLTSLVISSSRLTIVLPTIVIGNISCYLPHVSNGPFVTNTLLSLQLVAFFDIQQGIKKSDATNVYTWRKLREAYVKQAMLVRKVDGSIGGIIILSCFCNFYFICLQLFLLITQSQATDPIRTAYYFISLSWLCFRVISVVLAASDINAQSRLALKHIYTHDTQCYNVEVGRLQNQLSKDYVALSGNGFFILSKSILLQMASSIITYELVLIQFDDKGTDEGQLNLTKNAIGV